VSDVAERFAQNLAYHLKRAGLTQEDLAARSGIHRTQAGKLVNGKQVPRLDTLLRLAGALEVPAADLLDGMEYQPFQPAAQPGEFLFSPPKHESGPKRKPARKRKS
jgi:transcriptional regulator with XRE-family HTH domain